MTPAIRRVVSSPTAVFGPDTPQATSGMRGAVENDLDARGARADDVRVNRERTSRRADWLGVAGLFVVGLLLRIPFRSQWAYHWDGAQFALAVRDYNVALSQPHAPGYFLYVMLGRLVNQFVGDPHVSLVWVSVVFGSALPAVLFWLGTMMFDRRTGIAAGLFALTSPQVWFHSEVALTYVVDAVLVCLTVGAGWRAMQQGGRWRDAIVIGALVAVVGGVRPQTVPALCPLVAYVFWSFGRPRLVKLGLAATVAMICGALWFVPMVEMSEGLAVYLDILRRYASNNAPYTWAGGGWRALYANCFWVVAYGWNGLLAVALLLVGGLSHRLVRMPAERKREWDRSQARAWWTLGWWIVPMLLFGTVIQFTVQPGQVMCYLPAGLLLGGLVAAQLRRRWLFVSIVAIVVAVNGLAFLTLPAAGDGALLHVTRTAREIRQHDRRLAQAITAIRAGYRPAETVICHAYPARYDFGFRHFQLHMPEFDHYQLTVDPTIPSPDGRPLWCARNGHLEFVSGLGDAKGQRVLLVVPPGARVSVYVRFFGALVTQPVAGTGGSIYELVR